MAAIVLDELTNPGKLWSRDEVLDGDVVPRLAGVYAWYFRQIPPGVPTEGCIKHDGLTLLYAGISPKAPPQNGMPPSRETLRSRIRYHMRGNAEGSTLRLTLGCLLRERPGIQLRRVGSGTRLTFAEGEDALSSWMDENALVCWTVCEQPWALEAEIIRVVNLPLNLDQNRHHAFWSALRACRAAARERARQLPVYSGL
jgi:GIY-YIG catalytic domain